MMLAFGIVCALLEAKTSGIGQVIDASMVEGAAALMAMFFGALASGMHGEERGTNILDSGAPFYDVYETKDGRHVAVGPIEPQFFAVFREKLGLDAAFGEQFETVKWAAQKERLSAIFRGKSREDWVQIFAGTDACVSPVLSMAEVSGHPHNAARRSFVDVDGVVQAAPTPRFSRTVARDPEPAKVLGFDTKSVLADFGFESREIEELVQRGAVFAA
jgi:alpha-methylacyl-CoA racemase